MTILTSENFDREVLNSDKPVVVDFWATWCGPCMMLSPIMEELDGEMPDVKFCKLNVDDERDLAIEYGVQSIPMLLARSRARASAMPTRQASARASRRRYESTPERGQRSRREDPRGAEAHGRLLPVPPCPDGRE